MISSRYHGSIRLFLSLKIAGGLAIYWCLVWGLHLVHYGPRLDPADYLWFSLLIPAAAAFEFAAREKKYRSLSGLSRERLWSLTQRETLFILVAIFGILVMSRDETISRAFLTLFALLYSLWIAWMNQVGHRLIQRRLFHSSRSQPESANTIVLASPKEIKADGALRMSAVLPGADVLGYVSYGHANTLSMPSYPVLGEFDNIQEICRNCRAKVLFALGLDDSPDLIKRLQQFCDSLGMRLIWVDNKKSRFNGNLDTHQAGSDVLITNWQEPLEDPVNRALKRGMDYAIALFAALTILPPATLLVWIIHRAVSPGPLFYRQPRTGRNNEVFEILKFRTMHLNSNPGKQAADGDPRIFPGGRFLRKFSIDEFPQFLNVLRGEMSTVGPRPHYIGHDEQFAETVTDYRTRQFAKPGVTGLAQIRGHRGETKTDTQVRHRVRIDQFYLRHWSLALDLWIIVCTAFQVVFPPRSAR